MNFYSRVKIIDDMDRKLIEFIVHEKTNTEMAHETGYSIGYIKRRLTFLFKIFGVKGKAGLVREIFKLEKFLPNS